MRKDKQDTFSHVSFQQSNTIDEQRTRSFNSYERKGCQEAIAMVVKFQNPKGVKQSSKMVAQEEAGSSQQVKTIEMNNTKTSDGSIENRQQKRQRMLEQFLREVRRRGS